MSEENFSRFAGVRLGPKEMQILDEMKRNDFCEKQSHGIRLALREFAKNHGLKIEEEVPA